MKILQFINESGTVKVEYKVTLQDENDLDENFNITRIDGVESIEEIDKFYLFTQGRTWTLNEFKYFAVCNDYCLSVFDEQYTMLAYYGYCAFLYQGDYNNDFNNDFY